MLRERLLDKDIIRSAELFYTSVQLDSCSILLCILRTGTPQLEIRREHLKCLVVVLHKSGVVCKKRPCEIRERYFLV